MYWLEKLGLDSVRYELICELYCKQSINTFYTVGETYPIIYDKISGTAYVIDTEMNIDKCYCDKIVKKKAINHFIKIFDRYVKFELVKENNMLVILE